MQGTIMDKGYVESVREKVRDECTNGHTRDKVEVDTIRSYVK
jgi:hypothetical protein